MAEYKRKTSLVDSLEGEEIIEMLRAMEADDNYNTETSYSSNGDLNPGNRISFVDKHIKYLNDHRNVDPYQYLSNLRIMTRVR